MDVSQPAEHQPHDDKEDGVDGRQDSGHDDELVLEVTAFCRHR